MGLLIAVAVLATLASRTSRVPYPIRLVPGGLRPHIDAGASRMKAGDVAWQLLNRSFSGEAALEVG